MRELAEFQKASALFTGVEDWYATYRPGVPGPVRDWILSWMGKPTPSDELLDLGTGTGQVVEALGPSFSRISGVDPSASMLERAARKCSHLANGRTIQWIAATAEAAAERDWSSVRLVTICRSFHWMDQQRLLTTLDRTTPRHAGVVVFGDSSLWNAEEPWARAAKATVQEFLGEERRARSGKFEHHERPYAEILGASPFHRVDQMTIEVLRRWSIQEVLGYLYSTTFAAPDLFGTDAQRQAFEQRLAYRLSMFVSSDVLTEKARFTIQAARR